MLFIISIVYSPMLCNALFMTFLLAMYFFSCEATYLAVGKGNDFFQTAGKIDRVVSVYRAEMLSSRENKLKQSYETLLSDIGFESG